MFPKCLKRTSQLTTTSLHAARPSLAKPSLKVSAARQWVLTSRQTASSSEAGGSPSLPPRSTTSIRERMRTTLVPSALSKASVSTAPPLAAFEGIPRPQLRLIDYLVVKDLLGESAQISPMLERRLRDGTDSIVGIRKDIVYRANEIAEAHSSKLESVHLNAIAREAAQFARDSGGADFFVSMGSGARRTHSANCDDMTSAAQSEHAGRLQDDDKIDHIAVIDSKRQQSIHDVSLLRSAGDPAQPAVVIDGMAGGPQSPDSAVLHSDWRFADHSMSEPKRSVTAASAKVQLAEFKAADDLIGSEFHSEEIDSLLAEMSKQEVELDPQVAWPSLPVFSDEFISKAAQAVSQEEQRNPHGLREQFKDKATQVLGHVPSDAVVEWLIDEAKHLERTHQAVPAPTGDAVVPGQ